MDNNIVYAPGPVGGGFPAENLYAPGDGMSGNPVRAPQDAAIYSTPDQAGKFIRIGSFNVPIVGVVVVAIGLYLLERRRVGRKR
jgi:hypothetical protein